MDDFGSGYSSLNVLREYEFDLVKFDMSFVRKLNVADLGDPSGIMLSNLVSMVKELGMQTLIEGVEDVDQLAFLRNLSFSKIQGFVYGAPCAFDDLCSKIDEQTYVPEALDKRDYYDKIDRVNLMQPVEAASGSDPLGMAAGVPAAVLERRADGTIRYVEHNVAFEHLLVALGMRGVLDAESRMNRRVARGWQCMDSVVVELGGHDRWVDASCLFDGRVKGYVRCVAHVPHDDTMAVLFYALPLATQ